MAVGAAWQNPDLRGNRRGRQSIRGCLVAVLTSTATCTAFRAVEQVTGELVPTRLLAARVGFLAALIQAMSTAVVTARWNDADLVTIGSGVGPDGRALPSKGWMALRRLGWGAGMPDGVYVSDRVRRVAEEAAARALRLAVHRHQLLRAILAAWPTDPRRRTDAEWAALRQRLPQGSSDAEVRNRTRQVRAWQADHAGRLPACLTVLEAAPRARGVMLLAAADKQLVTIERVGPDTAVLRVQLPRTERPASRAQWAWHAIQVRLPRHLPADANPCVPTLRVTAGRVRLDLPWRRAVPGAPGAGHAVALGLDWGVNTLLTGTVGKLAETPSGTRVVTDGRKLRFDATGISAKLHRLRGNRETVAARRDHYARLLDGRPTTSPDRATLTAKHAVLEREHQRICARIRGLNHALAWAAARWAVDQAWALGATVIYVEDLAMLEARGRRAGNARLSGQVRGTVVAAIRHLASRQGVATVTVPARGTSKLCPGPCRGRADRHPRTARAGAGADRTEDRSAHHHHHRGGQRRPRPTPQAPHPRRSPGLPRAGYRSGRVGRARHPPACPQQADRQAGPTLFPPRARPARGSRPRSAACGQASGGTGAPDPPAPPGEGRVRPCTRLADLFRPPQTAGHPMGLPPQRDRHRRAPYGGLRSGHRVATL